MREHGPERAVRHRARRGFTAVILVTAVALVGVITGVGAATAVPVSSGPPPAYTIADPAFTALSVNGTPSRAIWGTHAGSGYEIEVPPNWNHQLILYAHGYAGTGTVLTVSPPETPLRQYWLDEGYAWAASSYDANGYNVPAGVKGTHELIGLFRSEVGNPDKIFMTGLSMGGQITGVEIEQYPKDFAGAMAWCGVMGDNQLFDYYYNFAQGAAALTGTPGQFPPPNPLTTNPDPYASTVESQILPKLGSVPNSVGFPQVLNTTGDQFAALAEQLTGGARPGFSGAFKYYWNSFGFAPLTQLPFVFGLFGSSLDGTEGIAPGNTTGNIGTVYSLANDPTLGLTSSQLASAAATVNGDIQRVAPDPQGTHPNGLSSIPQVSGNLPVPLLTLHGIGDMFVPFSMEQVLYERALAAGKTDMLVQRAIREVGHCSYSATELENGWDALVNWVATGHKPAGDNVMAPLTSGYDPTFGCQFTRPDSTDEHPVFAATNPGLSCPPTGS